jgi:hypothetical protein
MESVPDMKVNTVMLSRSSMDGRVSCLVLRMTRPTVKLTTYLR